MTAKPTFEPGALLGNRFRVEHVLGAGGMATVYAARHVSLGDPVAVKVMHRHLMASPTIVERFKREAQSGARARGPHCVAVLDVDTLPTGEVFIVMERLAGEDLGQRLKRVGRLHFAEAAAIVLQACEAVAVAHGLGIVHRDIKPSNLFLVDHGGAPFVKVVDFGIARISGTSDERPVTITQGDAVLGSPHYMAPEQWVDARRVDARADVWSLGATLYKAITGQAPFPGDSVPEICAAVLATVPARPSTLDPGIPAGLSDVIAKAMQKDRLQRYASVAELAAALRPFASAHGPVVQGLVVAAAAASPAQPTARPRRRRALVAWLVGATTAAIGAAVALFFLLRSSDASPRASKSARPSASAQSAPSAAPSAKATLAGNPLDPVLQQAHDALDKLGAIGTFSLQFGAPAVATVPNVDWSHRRIPALAAEDVAKRIERRKGYKVTKTTIDRTATVDRFHYVVQGFQCEGSAVYFRFASAADAIALTQGLAAARGPRIVRDEARVVNVMLGSASTGAPSAACTDSVAEALTE